jgi:transcriptional regulator GlxA family with amidase domain
MKLIILAIDGLFDTGLTVFMDVFATANELAAAQGFAAPPFDVRLVGVRTRIRTAHGLTTPVELASTVHRPDWVVVPAPNARQPERLIEALERRDMCEAMAYLRTWHADGAGVAAACIGTSLLAEAGLLDNCEATTTWSLAPFFRQRYPAVNLDNSRMVVASHRVVTAGSAMGHLDLALWLLRQASPDLATLVARFMLIDKRSSQAEYIIPDYLAHADPLVARFERWARDNLSLGFSLQAAAAALSVGPRTLQRRTEAVLGKSPLASRLAMTSRQLRAKSATPTQRRCGPCCVGGSAAGCGNFAPKRGSVLQTDCVFFANDD